MLKDDSADMETNRAILFISTYHQQRHKSGVPLRRKQSPRQNSTVLLVDGREGIEIGLCSLPVAEIGVLADRRIIPLASLLDVLVAKRDMNHAL